MLKAILVGNLGGEPEMQYTPNGQAFIRFTVASNYRAKNEAGNWDDMTEWVRVTLFGKRAETLSTLLHKGQKVYVDGRLESRPWTDRNGQVRSGLEVIANDCEFMSSRQDDQGGQPARQPVSASATPGNGQGRRPTAAEVERMDDAGELPF